LAKPNFQKKKPRLAGGTCQYCGSPLVWRINHKTGEPFKGCLNFNNCHRPSSREQYQVLAFPDGWKPNCSNDVFSILQKCDSRPEIRYILGAAYFLDRDNNILQDGISLSAIHLIHDKVEYEAINFQDPFAFWGGGDAPSAMAFVPQLVFAKRYHHDFGIFFAPTHSPLKHEWSLCMAIEIDVHPSHQYYPSTDKKRDSIVNYKVLRLKPENQGYLNWFSKVKPYWHEFYLENQQNKFVS
jgi:hypothetical protein